jgi:hypothetical protein
MIESTKTRQRFSVLAFLAFLIAIGLVPSAIHAQQPKGTLKGIVVDWQFALILPTTIVFEGTAVKKEIQVDGAGSYEIELPAGEYLVKATAPWFLERRVKFRVEPDQVKTLNMMLDVRPTKPIRCPYGALCL